MSDAVRARGLWKRYGGRDALAGLTLEIPAGTCFGLVGENGAGKSTLLRILATLIVPSEGEVEVLGEPLVQNGQRLRARIGFLGDHHLLPRDLSLEEGLRFYAELHGVAAPAARISGLAERLGLHNRLRDPVRSLSRGMGQRAALLRVQLHDPELLLLDEPFTALDSQACALVETWIGEVLDRGRSVVLVTHDLERARRVCRYGARLRRGKLSGLGPIAQVVEE
jgi:ABC-type multidrug transport system ATPase subunit